VSGATVTLCGTVKSSQSFLPIAHARVTFGAHHVETDGAGGFCFSNLPKPFVAAPGEPTHVLVAEADGFTPTMTVFTNTPDGGTVDVWIDGGAGRVYGTVYDIFTENVATGVLVRVPHPPPPGQYAPDNEGQGTKTSDSGYYDIEVPGGCEYVTIESDGRYQEVPIPRDGFGGGPLKLDIEFIPEPGLLIPALLLPLWRACRRAG
jgi:hypothetical protein